MHRNRVRVIISSFILRRTKKAIVLEPLLICLNPHHGWQINEDQVRDRFSLKEIRMFSALTSKNKCETSNARPRSLRFPAQRSFSRGKCYVDL